MIQHIAIMSIIDLYYATCRIATQTVAPTISGFQGLNRCIQYISSHLNKPIFYPYNSYDG